MRVATAAVAVLAAAALTFSPAQAGFDGEVNFILGQKSLDDFWSPPLDTGGGGGVIGAALMFNFGFDSVAAIDATLGIWADTGVFFRLGSHSNIGLDLRYSSAKVDLDFGSGIGARDVNAGGFSYVFLATTPSTLKLALVIIRPDTVVRCAAHPARGSRRDGLSYLTDGGLPRAPRLLPSCTVFAPCFRRNTTECKGSWRSGGSPAGLSLFTRRCAKRSSARVQSL